MSLRHPTPPPGIARPRMPSPARPAVASASAEPEQLTLPLASRAVLLAPDQAANLLGVTPRVLERWRASGDGPQFARLSRKAIRYRVEDLETFVASSLRTSTAPGAGRAGAARPAGSM